MIATPQIIRFQNPASTRRKSPGLLQLPLLPPGAAQFLASRLETDGVVDASLVTTRYRSTSPKLHGLSIAAGTYDSLHLLGTPPMASPSQPFHRPAASRWELQRPRDEVRAAETVSRDAFSAAVERLSQQLLRCDCSKISECYEARVRSYSMHGPKRFQSTRSARSMGADTSTRPMLN